MKTSGILLFAAASVALIVGCKKADPVVGTWNGPKGVSVSFKDDKTFSQGSGASAIGGSYTVDGKKIVLTVNQFGGKSIDDAIKENEKKSGRPIPKEYKDKIMSQLSHIEATLSEDGKSMSLTSPGGGAAQTLTKAEVK